MLPDPQQPHTSSITKSQAVSLPDSSQIHHHHVTRAVVFSRDCCTASSLVSRILSSGPVHSTRQRHTGLLLTPHHHQAPSSFTALALMTPS